MRIWVILLSVGAFLSPIQAAPLDDLKAIKELPVPTHLWPAPPEADPALVIELGRITGSVGVMAEDSKERIAAAVALAGKVKRVGKPVVLAVLWRPWIKPGTDPMSDAAWTEIGKANQYAKNLKATGAKAPWVCLVDAEGLDCRAELNRSRCADLYESYDLFVRSLGCQEVEWYSMAPIPAPAEPDEFSYHPFAVPFAGQASIGFEIYYTGESYLRRECARRAKATGIGPLSAWIPAPGSGRVFRWVPTYSDWTWNTGSDTAYDSQLGRELYGKWYRARPKRFMEPVDSVCIYPSPLDLRIVDPDRKHLLAFLRGATE